MLIRYSTVNLLLKLPDSQTWTIIPRVPRKVLKLITLLRW